MRLFTKLNQIILRACLAFVLLINSVIVVAVEPIEVTVLNYVEAKTDLHFDRVIAKGNSYNHWLHNRAPVSIEDVPQSSRRVNRDTLYSYAVVDISKGASFVLPDAGERYLSVQVINQAHYSNRIYYEMGKHELTTEEFDTPYVLLLARTLVNASDPEDIKRANALQDKFQVTSNRSEPYSSKHFDPKSLGTITQKLLSLAGVLPDAKGCFGRKDEVDKVRHLLATAYGWGGLPEREASYSNVQPNLPLGGYSLTVKDVPVEGFWSISVYNEDGYFEPNSKGVYSINNLIATPNSDGSFNINFGGDSEKVNHLPITDGWNYVVRMYRPREEILNGSWVFPTAK